MIASASASAGRTVDATSSCWRRSASSCASSVCLRTTSCCRLGLGQRPRLAGTRVGGRGLRLDLRAPKRDVPLGLDLDLLGLRLADRGLLVRTSLGHARVALDHRQLLLAHEVDVAGFVVDRLDRECVDLEAGGREVALRRVLDLLQQLLAVHDQLLDRQRADDGAERALEDVLDDRIDLLVAGVQEALGGVADRVHVAPDLERGDALDVDLDALAGDRVRQLDADLARGQLELADLVDEGQHQRAAADHDADALVVRVGGDRLALASRTLDPREPATISASFAFATR